MVSGSRTRRKVVSALRMLAALMLAGGIYTLISPGAAANNAPLSAAAQEGKELYASCISCHGENGQGVPDRGPSLVGVGSAAVEFQVETGRMPAAGQNAQIERKPPQFDTNQARQLGAYIQEQFGGGPQFPADFDSAVKNGDIARGGELFRINCSSCHAFSGGGGALSSGKFAPSLAESSARDIYGAMLTGPQNMPVFGDNQLTPEQKYDVIAYVQTLQSDVDPGGWGLGRFGPTTEGIAIFLFGMVALAFAALWIAGKS
ncbi:cytochrome bc1 complex diheme cytochrome c subunit [Catelliglobosispora koreensis]|uniref:cytochrome bc1 complex diheme cytochrome c subunit n=1 Tax=Catelliglobosispora koreensis TaxID=129052 RepID=UPI00037ED296|nr:c-type cytochrome [Catelliglobosispora koreensis]